MLTLQSPIAAWIPDPWFVNWFSSFENFWDAFIAGVLAFIMMYFGESFFLSSFIVLSTHWGLSIGKCESFIVANFGGICFLG